jgi:flagellar hook-basal body complex protein FliE
MNVAALGADAYAKSLTAGMLQLNGLQNIALNQAAAPAAQSGAFQEILSQVIDQNVRAEGAADEKTTQFLTGDATDLHEVMIAGEKADLAFQLTMAVRNKMVDAYQEVMRMQI